METKNENKQFGIVLDVALEKLGLRIKIPLHNANEGAPSIGLEDINPQDFLSSAYNSAREFVLNNLEISEEKSSKKKNFGTIDAAVILAWLAELEQSAKKKDGAIDIKSPYAQVLIKLSDVYEAKKDEMSDIAHYRGVKELFSLLSNVKDAKRSFDKEYNPALSVIATIGSAVSVSAASGAVITNILGSSVVNSVANVASGSSPILSSAILFGALLSEYSALAGASDTTRAKESFSAKHDLIRLAIGYDQGMEYITYLMKNLLKDIEKDHSIITKIDKEGNTALHLAAKVGFTEMANELIARGALLDSINDNGDTPLHIAARERKEGVAQILIEKNCNVNIGNKDKKTPLDIATEMSDVATIQLLAGKEREYAAIGPEQEHGTLIYYGPEVRHHILDPLSEKNADVRVINHNELNNQNNSNAKTLVLLAHGNILGEQRFYHDEKKLEQSDDFANKFFRGVKIIHAIGCSIGGNLESNFGINSLAEGQTLFIHSGSEIIPYGSTIVSHLTSKPNELFPLPNPVKIIYKTKDNHDIVTQLFPITIKDVAELVKNNENNITSAIYSAIRNNTLSQLKAASSELSSASVLVERDVLLELSKVGFREYPENPDKETEEKFVKNYLGNLLMGFLSASKDGSNHDALNLFGNLMRHGILDPNFAFYNGHTALYEAMNTDSEELVKFLIDQKASLTLGVDGTTPLISAIRTGKTKSAKVIIEEIAKRNLSDLNLKDSTKSNALYIASVEGKAEIVKMLIENGADLDAVEDFSGRTPLFMASATGQTEIVKMLIEGGADLNAKDASGMTPLFIASATGQTEIAKVITEAMAKDRNKKRATTNPESVTKNKDTQKLDNKEKSSNRDDL